MRFLSVCSGIEAASVAWAPLGWSAVAFSEIEPFPCAVLAHHYPDTPNWGDMTKYKDWPDVSIDLLCGGTPCQSFSVAGLRKGLDDPRGNLMLTFGAIAAKYRPKWLVWENVPGVLSSNGGADFGAFLGMLGELGYGFAYRVLDAQYFGVAQRRRRVFVVGCLGDWRSAAAVLFERHSMQGHPAPSRQARQDVAGSLGARASSGGGFSTDFECAGELQPAGVEFGPSGGRFTDVNPTLDSRARDGPIRNQLAGCVAVAGTMKSCKDSGGWSNSADHAAAGYMIPVATLCVATGQAGAEIGAEIAPTLNCNHEAPYAVYSGGMGGRPESVAAGHVIPVAASFKGGQGSAAGGIGYDTSGIAKPVKTQVDGQMLHAAMRVRRLTPVECARLQGFPDDYLDITMRGKPAADGPRYKALGNSWAVPNVRWIGEAIYAVAQLNGAQAVINK